VFENLPSSRFDGEVKGGKFIAPFGQLPAEGVADGKAQAFIRPHDFRLLKTGPLQVHTDRVVVQGPLARLEGKTEDGQRIDAVFARENAEALRGDVRLAVKRAHVFPA